MAGRDAWGTELRRSDMEAAPVFTAIAHVTNISGPTRSRDSYDVTTHGSPDQYREFIPGLKDGGEVTLSLNYDPDAATHQLLDDDFDDQRVRDYQIVVFPGEVDEVIWDFSGFVTNLGDEFPHDGKMNRSATMKVTGRPALTATAT